MNQDADFKTTDSEQAMGTKNLLESNMKPSTPTIPVVEVSEPHATDIVSLYNPVNCLRCDSLVHFTKKQHAEYANETGMTLLSGDDMFCHYNTGNLLCPALAITITTYVDMEKVVNMYIKAFEAGDVSRMQKILQRIVSKGPETEKIIMASIKTAMMEKATPKTVDIANQDTSEILLGALATEIPETKNTND